jgi:predicted dehydrogenase
MRQLIADGFIGAVLSCHVSCFRPGPLARPANRTWTRDVTQGATPFTIQAGHIIDTLRFAGGEFTELQAVVSTQSKQWYQSDTKQMVEVTSPDNVLVNGVLENGAVASVHVATVPWAASGYRMEIFGSKGTLALAHPVSSNHGNLTLRGAQDSDALETISVPDGLSRLPGDFPRGAPHAVGQMYSLFAEAIRTGTPPVELPTFGTAVQLHRLLDVIREASAARGTVAARL